MNKSRNPVMLIIGMLCMAVSGMTAASESASAEKYYLFVLNDAAPGLEDEFNKWYDEQHAQDVLINPTYVDSQRYAANERQLRAGTKVPNKYAIRFEIDTQDIARSLEYIHENIRARRTLEPQKGGSKAYALLREALRDSGKVGIAKVIIRTREHLAGVKTQGRGIILEIMHFKDELVEPESFKFPKAGQAGAREVQMAKKLIEGMAARWTPEKYEDEYKTQLMKMIEEKVKHPREKHPVPKGRKRPSNVIDLMSVLQESLGHAKAGKSRTKKRASKAKPAGRSAGSSRRKAA